MIKIIIADDHAIVRKGLRQIVSETPDIIVTGEASTGTEVLRCVRGNDYDVVVLDISMPGGEGLNILKQIKKVKSKIPILVLSVHPEDQYAVRALRAGAAGYLTKESAPDELITAIRRVSGGRKYVSSQLAEKLAFHIGVDGEKKPHENLSDREYQVLCMIASGKRVTEIGDELRLSVKTVSTYRARILEKMRMKSNAALTHYAFKHGLVE
jgi:two-component system invasion response regulator UvrY